MPYMVQRQTIQGSNTATFTFPDDIGLLFYGIDSFHAQVDDDHCEIAGLGIALAIQSQTESSVTISVTFTLTNGDMSNSWVGVTVLAYIGGGPPDGLSTQLCTDVPSGKTQLAFIADGTPSVLAAALSAFSLSFDGNETSELVGLGAGIGAVVDLTQSGSGLACCAVSSAVLTGDYTASSNTIDGNLIAMTPAASDESGVYVGVVDNPGNASSLTVNVGAPVAQVAIFLKSFFAQFSIALIKTGASPELSAVQFAIAPITVPGDGTFSFSPSNWMSGQYAGPRGDPATATSIAASYLWVAVPGTGDAVGDNLIQNPGFEDGLTGWTTQAFGGSVEVTQQMPYQGSSACLLATNDGLFGEAEIQQMVTASVAGTYQFVAYARAMGAYGSSAYFRVTVTVGDAPVYWTVLSPNVSWTPYGATFLADAGDSITVTCGVVDQPSIQVELDAVAVVLVPSAPSLAFNPGFATGSLFPWQGTAGTTAVTTVDGVNLAVLAPTASTAAEIYQTVTAPEANQYKLTATASTTITSGVALTVTVNGGVAAQQAVTTGAAQGVTLGFSAPAGATIVVSYTAPAGSGQATLSGVDLQLAPGYGQAGSSAAVK